MNIILSWVAIKFKLTAIQNGSKQRLEVNRISNLELTLKLLEFESWNERRSRQFETHF